MSTELTIIGLFLIGAVIYIVVLLTIDSIITLRRGKGFWGFTRGD